MRSSFVIGGGTGFCNSVRRCLLADLESESPSYIDVRRNTSCQTDEFIAHRIGMMPFRRKGEGVVIDLKVKDEHARSSHFTGASFESTMDVMIMPLERGQELDLSVTFDKNRFGKHARYCKCAAVGMEKVDGEGRHKITFHLIDGSDPKQMMSLALKALEKRVDDALLDLSNRDAPPPKTLC